MVYIVIKTDGAEATVTTQEGEEAAAQATAAPGAATPPSAMLAAALTAGAQDAGPGPAAEAPTTTGAPPLPFQAAPPGATGAGPDVLNAGAAPGTRPEPPPTTVQAEDGE